MKLQSYLIRMSLSIVAMIGVGLFFTSTLWAIFLSNPRLNALIIGLTFGGIAYAFYQLFRLKNDCEVLEDLKQGQWSFSTHPKGYFLDTIISFISQKKTTLDPLLGKGLADSLADRLDNERVFPRYLIGLLVFLGLLGTFWGLSQTITSIAHLIQNMPSDEAGSANFFSLLKESLHSPLAGMGTAFSSSLFGLGGSLLVGFLELQVGHAYGRFLNEADLYLTTCSYSKDKDVAIASAPLGYLQALLTRNVECIDHLTQTVEKSEKNDRQTAFLLDKLLHSLSIISEQSKTQHSLMIKLAEGQIDLQSKFAALSLGSDEESHKYLYKIEQALVQSLQNQRDDREELLRKLKEEMRLIARTIANLGERE
ncbi:MAG: hypothetical protein KA112_04315 [Alphaproteobacteria bacterium]|jgi:hypothetical protein|nr:hypothetical protein [Alphaproteobacteria bacterium]MBP7729817.1 hypothetical protein [Alphaproteobacteria bacterium]